MSKKRIACLLAAPIALLGYNICRAPNLLKYFEMPLYWILSLATTIFVVYWLTQRITDKRRETDVISFLLNQTLSTLCDEKMYKFETTPAGNFFGYAQQAILVRRFQIFEEYIKKLIKKNKNAKSTFDYFNNAKGHLEAWWDVYNEVMNNEQLRATNERKLRIELLHCIEELEKVQSVIY